MTIITREHVAIAELIVYIPVGLIAAYVVFRHGFHRQLGWIYLFALSNIRIGGGIMEICSYNDPSNTSYQEWSDILQSVGLSPLLLSSLGLLKRICDELSPHIPDRSKGYMDTMSRMGGIGGGLAEIYGKRATANSRRSRCVQLLHIPALVALILSIAGGTNQFSSSASDQSTGKTQSRVGILIFLGVYICLILLTVITFRDWNIMQRSQRRIFVCILIALPLIAVRVLYSLIGDFNNNTDNQFSVADGSPTIQVAMATAEEIVIVIMYAILGVITPRTQDISPNDETIYLSTQQQDVGYAPPTNYDPYASRNAYQSR